MPQVSPSKTVICLKLVGTISTSTSRCLQNLQVGSEFQCFNDLNESKCLERVATQLPRKRKERDLDKDDAEADGPRKRSREVHDETSDGLMVRFLS